MVVDTMSLESLFQELGKVAKSAEGTGRLDLLTNVKIGMGALNRAELAEVMTKLDLSVLFECLSSSNMEEIQSTCEILRSLMLVVGPVECLTKYEALIMSGFLHPVPDVPMLVMAHLTRCLDEDETSLLRFPGVISAVTQQLVSADLGPVKQADKLLLQFAKTDTGKAYFLTGEASTNFSALLKNSEVNDTKKFRVFEVVSNLATISPQHFQHLNQTVGFMEVLINMSFKGNDPLSQFNALEIIANLAGCPHGQQALREAGVFQEIQKLTETLDSNPMGQLLFPALLKFIGKVGAVQLPPKEMVTIVTKTLLDSGKDYDLKTIAVEAFSHIGSTVEGKRYYKALPDIKQHFVAVRELIVSEAAVDWRVRGLEAMAFLFGSDESNEDCLPHWFNYVFHDMSELFDCARLPFPEMRIAALHVMAAIANFEWAQRHFLRGPGVMEFLVSRHPEPEKECVYAKYNLVKIIVKSPSTAKILTQEQLGLLKLYVAQGPFYATADTAVATANAGP